MKDFPPYVDSYWSATGKPGAEPDTRSPWRLLAWMLGRQPGVIALSLACGLFWYLPQAIGPYIFGRAIDDGIVPGDVSTVVGWSIALLALTLLANAFGIANHTLVVRSWLIALYGTTQLVTRKTVQMGHVLPRRSPTGEVLSVAASDSDEIGAMTEIIARVGGQLIAFGIVAASSCRRRRSSG